MSYPKTDEELARPCPKCHRWCSEIVSINPCRCESTPAIVCNKIELSDEDKGKLTAPKDAWDKMISDQSPPSDGDQKDYSLDSMPRAMKHPTIEIEYYHYVKHDDVFCRVAGSDENWHQVYSGPIADAARKLLEPDVPKWLSALQDELDDVDDHPYERAMIAANFAADELGKLPCICTTADCSLCVLIGKRISELRKAGK